MVNRCSFEFEPATWEKEYEYCAIDEDEDLLTETDDGRVVWRCPHEAVDGTDRCQFHLPADSDAKPDADTLTDEFTAVVNGEKQAIESNEPRPAQFIGTTFESLNLSDTQIGNDQRIDLRHAEIEEADWSGITVQTALDARGMLIREIWTCESTVFNSTTRFDEVEFGDTASFEGAEFGDTASFNEAEFGDTAWFVGAEFGGGAWFSRAEFGGIAFFKGTEFGGETEFYRAEFGDTARFGGAEFSDEAWFSRAEFDGIAFFEETEFGGEAWFIKAKFGHIGRFDRAEFGDTAQFDRAEFGGGAWFSRAEFGDIASFKGAEFGHIGRFVGAEFGGETEFYRAEFGDTASFNEAEFGDTASFKKAEFGDAAQFDRVEFGENVDFDKASFTEGAVFTAAGWYPVSPFQADASFKNISTDGPIRFDDTYEASEGQRPYMFLGTADFTGADISNAEFSGVSFAEPPSFDNADLTGADMSGLPLDRGSFTDADLTRVDFSETSVTGGRFNGAVLERAALYGTDFRNAQLYGARLAGAHISDHTDWGIRDISTQRTSQIPLRGPWPAVRYDTRNPEYDQYADDEHKQGRDSINDYSRAAGVYAEIKRVAEMNAASDLTSRCFRWRKDMLRRRYKSDAGRGNTTERLRWGLSWMSNLVARYGDSPWRVVYASIGTVLLFGVLYPFFGGMQSTAQEGQLMTFSVSPTVSAPQWVEVLAANLYFSAVTFTTLGYGDIQPAGPISQFLASVESFLGAALLALLVAVLARRLRR